MVKIWRLDLLNRHPDKRVPEVLSGSRLVCRARLWRVEVEDNKVETPPKVRSYVGKTQKRRSRVRCKQIHASDRGQVDGRESDFIVNRIRDSFATITLKRHHRKNLSLSVKTYETYNYRNKSNQCRTDWESHRVRSRRVVGSAWEQP